MNYFSHIRTVDRVTFEGKIVETILPLLDKSTKSFTHYNLIVREENGEPVSRKFRQDEIPYLVEQERLVIDKGYHSLARQADRAQYKGVDLSSLKPCARGKADRKVYLAKRMAYYHRLGMKLTRDGVYDYRRELERDFARYQCLIAYGTEKPNSNQKLYPLPQNSTLLEYYKKFRFAGSDPRIFIPAVREQIKDFSNQALEDLRFVLFHLADYASAEQPSKKDVAAATRKAVIAENTTRRLTGSAPEMRVLSVDRYTRYIDMYLDPFMVIARRDGLAAARKEFGSVEKLAPNLVPGEEVLVDAWQVHVVTLDVTREAWARMTEEQRRKVKKVRRWIVTFIDVATRFILGFALCRNPSQAASLEALRMCFMDKTPYFRAIGLQNSKWDQRSRIFRIVSDSGSEFGQSPFGGAAFGEAVRRLTGSFMTTTAGVPELRGMVERMYLTFDLQWARKAPGYTAANPTKLNDRKPHAEACMTDDDLHEQLVAFIAFYNHREHRGIGFFTPAGMWEKLSDDPLCDPTDIPGPAALREACGVEHVASISEDGIKFKGIKYSNEFVREQRRAIGVDRIDRNGGRVEIKFDPMDLGAISLRINDTFATIPAVDQNMRGVRLCDWKEAGELRRSEARQDALDKAPARDEAGEHIRGHLDVIKAAASVDTRGASVAMISRAAMELNFGKGQHEKPFVGRDEYQDPVHSGFALSGEEPWQSPVERQDYDVSAQHQPSTVEPVVDPNEVKPDSPNAMDRFRSQVKPRSKR